MVRPRVAATVAETQLGWIAFAWRGEMLLRLSFGHRQPQQAVAALGLTDFDDQAGSPFATGLMDRLRAFADGQSVDFLDVAIDQSNWTAFQSAVVRHCRGIGYGHTMSYRQLAAAAGSPRAARAVGNVMRTNRFPLVVPCHRVVGSNGQLGGYSAPDGLSMKRRLLALEQAVDQTGTSVAELARVQTIAGTDAVSRP